MTEGALFVTGWALLAGVYANMVLDYILTVKALDKGYKEVGLIASKVVAKWGAKALPLFTFLSAVAVTAGAAALATAGAPYLVAGAAGFLAVEVVNNVRNARTLKIL